MTRVDFKTLISVDELKSQLHVAVVFDCRHRLADPAFGRKAFLESHIPGARFAHLDVDLSAPVVPGKTGRHPLPDLDTFTEFLRQSGVSNSSQVVAYDDAGGAIAARLWWLLRWIGHDNVAVLDGGFPAWVAAEGPVESGEPGPVERGSFQPSVVRASMVVDANMIVAQLASEQHDANPPFVLVDARAPDRFDGSNETIDPVGGHIPGALSIPYAGNLDERGFFKSPETLRARFDEAVATSGATPDSTTVASYCGSGVTAAHNVLAMVHAGMPEPALYPGSWSEWITDPERPVAS